MKVSVVLPIYRPGYTDTIIQSLSNQTLPKSEWELVLVDELHEQRKEALKAVDFNLKHISQEPSLDIAAAAAVVMGLNHCEGQLIYLMCDYNYPHPRCLERHWGIFEKYGPKVMISGPIIDAFNIEGKSIWLGTATTVRQRIITGGTGKNVSYPVFVDYDEFIPPVPLQLRNNFSDPTPQNIVSIFTEPFQPVWPKNLVPDWRISVISNVSLEKDLYECIPGTTVLDGVAGPEWWWWRNDSVSMEGLRAIQNILLQGSIDEADGRYTRKNIAPDTLMAMKLMEWGCRYLVDREAPSYILPHPWRKRL